MNNEAMFECYYVTHEELPNFTHQIKNIVYLVLGYRDC